MAVTLLIVNLTVKYIYFASKVDQNALKPENNLIYTFILSPKFHYSPTRHTASRPRQYKSLKNTSQKVHFIPMTKKIC
jgi:hypothetical protein